MMTIYPIILNYLDELVHVVAFKEELKGFYDTMEYMYNMNTFLDVNHIPLKEDKDALNHFSSLVVKRQLKLDEHVSKLKKINKFFQDNNLPSTPDMSVPRDIGTHYNDAHKISRRWIKFRKITSISDYNRKIYDYHRRAFNSRRFR